MVVDENRFPFRKLTILFQSKMTPAACFYQDQLEALGNFGNVWFQKGGLYPDQDWNHFLALQAPTVSFLLASNQRAEGAQCPPT